MNEIEAANALSAVARRRRGTELDAARTLSAARREPRTAPPTPTAVTRVEQRTPDRERRPELVGV